MCKILWKKWLKYFCWSDEASDSCWDDSESDTPDHSTRAGLGADSTLSTILRLSLLHQNVHEIVSRLSLSTIKLPTLLSAISVCIQPWFMISVLSPSSVSHLCPGPLPPLRPSPPTLTGDMGPGASNYIPLLWTSIYLASQAILQKMAVTLIGTSCILMNILITISYEVCSIWSMAIAMALSHLFHKK